MAEITAAAVMKLRKMSGQGMMDCKKALAETNGDVEEAMNLLRKKGLATMEKRAGRDTSEGKIVVKTVDDGKTIAMVSLCCETDFVAKNDDFIASASLLADYALASDDCSSEGLGNAELNGKAFKDVITELVSKTGEKTEIGDCAKFTVADNGLIGTYIHFNDKIGAMVEVEADSAAVAASDDVKAVANDICMHISANKPLGLNPESLDPAMVANEKAIATEQVKNKPANIIDKIVEGKMNKFYADNCLVAQKFVKNEDLTVEQALTEAAKKAGGSATIKRFVRIEIA